MARIWTETFNPKRHADKMRAASVPTVPALQRHSVYFVSVTGFTFEFHNIQQLEVCLRFFSQKVRPESMMQFLDTDRHILELHAISPRWFQELPLPLLEEHRRLEIAAALTKALRRFRAGTGITPVRKKAPQLEKKP
jgi:hypothetical protein